MKAFSVAVLMFCFFAIGFAGNGENGKEVVYEEVNKTTKMAFIYDASGNLIEKGLMVNGKRDGVWQGFNTDGVLVAEVTFKNGNKDGVWKIYKDAELAYVLFYQNNERLMAEDLAVAQ